MNTVLQLRPRQPAATLIAWQFLGQPLHQWPSWVQACCSLRSGMNGKLELRHERRSGTQIVYMEEWLVKDLDGSVCFYTAAELSRDFEV